MGCGSEKLHYTFTGTAEKATAGSETPVSALISSSPRPAPCLSSHLAPGREGRVRGNGLCFQIEGVSHPFRNLALCYRGGIAQPAPAGSTPFSCFFARLAVRNRLARNSDGEARKRLKRGEEQRTCPKQAASCKLRGRDEHTRRARFWSNRRLL
jgi:hypothetical protein